MKSINAENYSIQNIILIILKLQIIKKYEKKTCNNNDNDISKFLWIATIYEISFWKKKKW